MDDEHGEQFQCELALELERRRKRAELAQLLAHLERDRPDAFDYVEGFVSALASGRGRAPRGQQ
jgi:hypothetical protein